MPQPQPGLSGPSTAWLLHHSPPSLTPIGVFFGDTGAPMGTALTLAVFQSRSLNPEVTGISLWYDPRVLLLLWLRSARGIHGMPFLQKVVQVTGRVPPT